MKTQAIQAGAVVALAAFLASSLLVRAEDQKRDTKKPEPAVIAKSLVPAKSESLPLAPLNPDYRIGVNDVLDVHVWKEPELSRVIPVRPDGKVSLPLVGEVEAKGRSPLELRNTIADRLKAYVSHPEVTVIVQQINSQRYFVIGEVQSPGTYPLTVPVTVMQALAAAGGFREFADTGKITIIRRTEDDRTVRIRFNYKDWLKKKKRIEHLQLANGDVVVVP
ncbi:MAG: polysaccharide biosynthesis/export family protein [Terriglobia bacterium]